jgi:hypothetical protein
MTLIKIIARARLLAALGALLPTGCALLEPSPPANPLIGSWATADRNRVTFSDSAVVVTPADSKPTTMGAADCNGRYKLLYGRMMTAALEQSFPSQPDLQSKLKQLLVRPDYPVADLTCDQGGTTYLMLDDRRMIAVYRDSGVGGLETYSRL